MSDKPKTAFELAMERLKAEDKEAGTKETPLSAKQKEAIAEARRVASSRLAEREILFRDSMKRTPDPELRAEGRERVPRRPPAHPRRLRAGDRGDPAGEGLISP